MSSRTILAPVAAAVALFFWGFVYWTILAPAFDIYRSMGAANEAKVTSALKEHVPESGVFFYPATTEEMMADEELWMTRHKEGPIVQIFFVAEGLDPMSPTIFAAGFLHMLLCAALVTGLLVRLKLRDFSQRFYLVGFLGIFAGAWVELSKPIWFFHEWRFSVFSAVYTVTAWMISAAVLAFLVRPAEPVDA